MKLIQFYIFFLLSFCLISCDVTTDAEYYNNMTNPPLKLVRWPYLQNNIADSVTIAWKTTNAAKSCYLEYGTDLNNLVKIDGKITPQSVNTMNQVTIRGLEPNSKYFYKVYTNDVLMYSGKENYFYAAKTINETFSFITVADAGQPPSWRGHSDQTSSMINKLEEKPDFVLGLGDMVYPEGESEGADDYFFKPFQKLLRNTAIYPVPGNHDHKSNLEENFKQEWILPGNEQWYSFDYSNAHFIGLDTGDDFGFTNCDEQMAWFENDLKDAYGCYDWIILFLHHHGKSCTYKGEENDVLRIYPKLVEYNVDLVLNGHIHTYERLKPIDSLGLPLIEYKDLLFSYPAIDNGFIAVTAGTTGKLASWEETVEQINCKEMYVAKDLKELGFVKVQINRKKLLFQFIGSETGDILDHFTIDKGLQTF